ncbi:MAG: putative DNA binding domain-containing protein, partial [Clostridia bacterium]|nr:putative DNA binding domain-containing protein [Clostridia bacterium]
MELGKESEILEFKESTGERHEACESIAAIINKHGYGTLYFGVYDNGEIRGQIINDSTIKDISELISINIEPRIVPTIEHIIIDEKDVLKVTFSGNQKPYSAFGKFLIRVGTQNRKMSRDELIKIVQENNYSLNWEKDDSKVSLDDIDDDTLMAYYNEAVNCGRLELKDYSKAKLLTMLDLYKNGIVTNAAYVIFGKNPNIGLKLSCYATDDKISFTDLKLFKNNVYSLINESMIYLKNHINWRIKIGDVQRIEIPEIPIRALREMVINAFAHANYQNFLEIEINIHPGKITIFNPGSFPLDLTPYDYIEKDIPSIKRNPLILDTLFRCKDVEKAGTGFKRMNELCEHENIKWSYENLAYGFTFIFYRNNVNTINKEYIQTNDILNDLTKDEISIYTKIKDNTKVLKSELITLINKSDKTVQRCLNSLIKKGYILRIGNN